jgi:uncharacterized damage-inducible protein DinB
MKTAIILAALLATPSLVAEDANPLSTDAREAYTAVKNNILKSAEKMPEQNYGFKPAPRVRTFGQILGHVAEEQYIYCGAVRGEQKAVDVEKNKTAKADLMAALEESFTYCDVAYNSLTDAAAANTVEIGASRRTKLRLLWGNTVHDTSHYGNLVTYMRIKGLVPPSTEGQ